MARISWRRIPLNEPALVRSSHSLAVLGDDAYIFGGELSPRKPVDAKLHRISLHDGKREVIDDGPEARVGAGLIALNGALYLFGGRGGKDMTPLPSTLHKYDPTTRTWSEVETTSPPEARSYHVLTTLDGQLVVHAGCPAKGRSAQLSAMAVGASTWSELPPAPEPGRGGTALATIVSPDEGHALARWGGFAGYELGGPLHVFRGGEWTTPEVSGPEPPARSVHSFVGLKRPLRVEGGGLVAVMAYGEADPAPEQLGHDGAGKFHSDVWGLAEAGDGKYNWLELQESGSEGPSSRGWFASAPWHHSSSDVKTSLVIHGGLNDRNERLGDLWVLDIEAS